VISPGSSAYLANINALRDGLRDLGYAEDRNIVIELRFADGQFERVPQFVTELVAHGVGLLVVSGTTPVVLAKKAAPASVPIVFTGVSDPIEAGVIVSFARPGGNATGTTTSHEDGFAGKWLELIKETLPGVSHVAVLHNPGNPSNLRYWRDIQFAGLKLRVTLQPFEARTAEGVENALAGIGREQTGAVIVVTDPLFFTQRSKIVDAVRVQRIPSMFGFREFVDLGGLMSYGASLPAMWRRTATYVDRILKGAKPGDLPVEQPTKFDLVINLKTAKALRLAIPQSMLLRADEVIQ
jgi:putative tryptophan/tyrosine transport system substrate-binding protein